MASLWIDQDLQSNRVIEAAEQQIRAAEAIKADLEPPWDGGCARIDLLHAACYAYRHGTGIVLAVQHCCYPDVHGACQTSTANLYSICCCRPLGFCGLVRICDDEALKERGVIRASLQQHMASRAAASQGALRGSHNAMHVYEYYLQQLAMARAMHAVKDHVGDPAVQCCMRCQQVWAQ